MKIKNDMPFLAKMYNKATEEQKEEIRKMLGIKTDYKDLPEENDAPCRCSDCRSAR